MIVENIDGEILGE